MRSLTRSIGIMCAAVAMLLSTHAPAANMPKLSGEVVLKIAGDLPNPNVGGEFHFDMAMLQSFPVTEFTTHSPWSDDPQHFEGVRLNVLLNAIGTEARQFVAEGLDDYKFTVTDIDFDAYPIIIAYRQDGELISVRKLGPLRIMMPFDDHPELLSPKNESSCVWQLVSMELL